MLVLEKQLPFAEEVQLAPIEDREIIDSKVNLDPSTIRVKCRLYGFGTGRTAWPKETHSETPDPQSGINRITNWEEIENRDIALRASGWQRLKERDELEVVVRETETPLSKKWNCDNYTDEKGGVKAGGGDSGGPILRYFPNHRYKSWMIGLLDHGGPGVADGSVFTQEGLKYLGTAMNEAFSVKG